MWAKLCLHALVEVSFLPPWGQLVEAREDLQKKPAIYFYEVPSCARDEAREAALEGDSLTDPEQLHLRGLMRQVTAIEAHLERWHRVARPEDASLFLVPAYFPLLFWLDQRTSNIEEATHLECVRETVRHLEKQPFLARNAGYDHVLLYGYEYPHWKRLSHLVLDSYSPFLGNSLLVAVSFWSQGRRSALLDAGLYQLLRVVAVPYFAVWDCGLKETLLHAPREFTVSFAGSIKNKPPYFVFRERLYVAGAVSRPELANDSRLVFEAFEAGEAQRYSFARNFEGQRAALYSNSDFCLAMPGDGNTAGRLFDAMVLGCVPVLLFHPDSYPVLPFLSHIPWHDFAVVISISSEEDAAQALHRLLAFPAETRREMRRRLLEVAPLVALGLERCPEETRSALDLVSEELQQKALMLQSSVLPGMQTAPPPEDAEHWLHWGPSPRLAA